MNKVASLIVAYVLLCTTQRVQVLPPLFGVSSFYVHLFVCARVWAKQTFSNITKLNLSIVTGVLFGCFSSQMFLFNCVVSVHWTSHVEMAFFSQMLCHTCPIWILYSLFWLRGGWVGLTHLSSSLLLLRFAHAQSSIHFRIASSQGTDCLTVDYSTVFWVSSLQLCAGFHCWGLCHHCYNLHSFAAYWVISLNRVWTLSFKL